MQREKKHATISRINQYIDSVSGMWLLGVNLAINITILEVYSQKNITIFDGSIEPLRAPTGQFLSILRVEYHYKRVAYVMEMDYHH